MNVVVPTFRRIIFCLKNVKNVLLGTTFNSCNSSWQMSFSTWLVIDIFQWYAMSCCPAVRLRNVRKNPFFFVVCRTYMWMKLSLLYAVYITSLDETRMKFVWKPSKNASDFHEKNLFILMTKNQWTSETQANFLIILLSSTKIF